MTSVRCDRDGRLGLAAKILLSELALPPTGLANDVDAAAELRAGSLSALAITETEGCLIAAAAIIGEAIILVESMRMA
jgi:hypothetical protein